MIKAYLAMENELLIAASQGDDGGSWQVQTQLAGTEPTCVAIDPADPQRVYCGTFGRGVWKSEDAGKSWKPIGNLGKSRDGGGVKSAQITSIAVSAVEHSDGKGVVYAGTEPTALYRSEDGGDNWKELSKLRELPSSSTWSFPPRPYTSHVRWITPDPLKGGRIFAAIEAGALVKSSDGGAHWEDRVRNGPFDTHTLLMHPRAPDRLYSSAGDDYNESRDGGMTWKSPSEGLPYHYLWGLAIDPKDPETMIASASPGPYEAHHARSDALSIIARKSGDGPWQQVTSGLPDPRGTVAPVLASNPEAAHTFYALTNRGLYRSQDAGENWNVLPVPWKDSYRLEHQQALAVSTL